MPLVEISTARDDVAIELRYAGANNFTGRPIYGAARCLLHPAAAAALARAAGLAKAIDLRLHIWDAFRPTEAQWALWRHTPDPDFVADPAHGSPHSRGVAVDLTLARSDGSRLAMGTDFDDFSALAGHGAAELSATVLRNRALLLGLMTAAGWDFYAREWWHYQLPASRRFPLLSDSAAPLSLLA